MYVDTRTVGRSRLGGAASFQAMQPMGTIERARAAVESLDQQSRMDEMNAKIFFAAMESKKVELDRECDAKCAMPPEQLGDFAYQLAQDVLEGNDDISVALRAA